MPAKEEGAPDLERRPSIDLAAGLNRSPRRNRGGCDEDDDVDIRPGLFPHFRSANAVAPAGAHYAAFNVFDVSKLFFGPVMTKLPMSVRSSIV